jgi:hypothetical protein
MNLITELVIQLILSFCPYTFLSDLDTSVTRIYTDLRLHQLRRMLTCWFKIFPMVLGSRCRLE